jgi:hypothetical protein
MSTPYNYIEATGIITADTSDFLTQVQSEWQSAFGADIALTADTPQGKQITAETTARTRVAQMMAMLSNMMNPNQAGGVFLDALCAFLGIERDAATFTVVPNVALGGQPNLAIAAGSMVAKSNSTGMLFTNTLAIQFATDGTAVSDFECLTAGPVECPVGDLEIGVQILGWETINNASAGVPGELEESDGSLRNKRNNTLAKQGISTVEAQISDLNDVPGVLSLKYRENYTKVDATIDGIFLLANSVWACVDGGADEDIALSLLTNKTDGANWNGATSVQIVEPNSGQTYTVKFDRPTVLPVLVRVTLRQGTSTANLVTAVPQAVVDYSNGVIPDNFETPSLVDPGFVVGAQVSPFDIGSGVSLRIPGVTISKVEVAFAGTSPVFQTTELAIALNQKGAVTLASVQTVIVS